MARHTRDFRFGWFGRKQAAKELGITERALHDRARKGQIRTIQKGKRRLYYVGNSPQVRAYSALPVTHYRADGTFVVWITFTKNACTNYADTVGEWCQAMESKIKEYIELKISPIEIVEGIAARKENWKQIEERKRKYFEVMRIVTPARTVRITMSGSKGQI